MVIQGIALPLFSGKSLVTWNEGGFVKQDLKEALPKVRNLSSFTLRTEKNKGGFVKPGHKHTQKPPGLFSHHSHILWVYINLWFFREIIQTSMQFVGKSFKITN